MSFEIKLAFDCRYDVRHGDDLPPSGAQQFHYPPEGGTVPGGVEIVHVIPQRRAAWVGVFDGKSGMSGCFSCPDGDSLAVVSHGSGYVVRADDPARWESVKAFPIVDAVVSEEAGLLLLVDYTGIEAYDRRGLLWSNLDVSTDGVEIQSVSERVIEGMAWGGGDYRFVLDTRTGRMIEGRSTTTGGQS